MNAILVSFSIGFLGSFHCVGMCGGLVAALSSSRRNTWWGGLANYQIGRISTYVVMGALSGMLGAAFSAIGWFHQTQFLFSVLAGIMMIVFGLHIAGWMPDPFVKGISRAYQFTGLGRWVYIAKTSTHPMSWFIVGVFNGLLPCGLVYAGLSFSLSATNVPQAALMMLSFGLGTIPAMMLAPVLLQKTTLNIRRKSIKAAAVLVVCLGVITVLRGSGWMHHNHDTMPPNHMAYRR